MAGPDLRTRSPRALPGWVWIPAGLVGAFLLLPLVGLAVEVDWHTFWGLVTSQSALQALRVSLITATISTIACVLFGVPTALVLARARVPRTARALVLLPLVLPPVVSGLALLYVFGRQGLLGGTLDFLGVRVAFSMAAVVLAQTFVSLPFLVISLEGALRQAGRTLEDVALAFGGTPTSVLRFVTLPTVLPALGAGAVLSFARALGEFGATLTFAGSFQGVTRTLPLEVYLQRESDPAGAVALSLVLVVVAVVVIVVARPGRHR
ncbi:ABC transporter permease [soil metagenome]